MSQPTGTISPLRQRMIDDMNMRRLKPGTQRSHVRAIVKLATFLGRPPQTATAEDLRRFQLHLASCGVSAGTINCTVTGLRFFYDITLDRPQVLKKISSAAGIPTVRSSCSLSRTAARRSTRRSASNRWFTGRSR